MNIRNRSGEPKIKVNQGCLPYHRAYGVGVSWVDVWVGFSSRSGNWRECKVSLLAFIVASCIFKSGFITLTWVITISKKFQRITRLFTDIDWVRCTKRCLVHHSRIAQACQGRWSECSPQVNVKAGSISASRRCEKGWKSASCAGRPHRTIRSRLSIQRRSVKAEAYTSDVWYVRSRPRTKNEGGCHLIWDILWQFLLIFYCGVSQPQSTKKVSAAFKVRS